MKVRDKICPACGAECFSDAEKCWLCLRQLPAQAEMVAGTEPEISAANPYRSSVSRDRGESYRPIGSSGDSWLMMVVMAITLVALGIGTFTIAPGLGIAFCILVTPALIRTAVIARRRERAGAETSAQSTLFLFLASLLAVITAGVAAVAVFFGTCVAVCFGAIALDSTMSGDDVVMLLFWGGMIVGVVAGLYCGFRVLKVFKTS